MKAISLWQPWASFIAVGVKSFETRSWSPPPALIGQRIAIHAAKKKVDAEEVEWARRCGAAELPLGAIVCTAVLAGAYQCGPPLTMADADVAARERLRVVRQVAGSLEQPTGIMPDEFGDYADGRWAWLLREVRQIAPPRAFVGRQGFFDLGYEAEEWR